MLKDVDAFTASPQICGQRMVATTFDVTKFFPDRQGTMRMTGRVIQKHNCATKIQAVARGWRMRLENNTLAEALEISEDANKGVLAWSDHRYSAYMNSSYSSTTDEHAAAKRIQTQARRRFAMKHHGTGPSGQTEVPEHDAVGYSEMSVKEDGTESQGNRTLGLGLELELEGANPKPVDIARRFQDPLDKVEAVGCIQRQIKHRVTAVRGENSSDHFDGRTGKSRAKHRQEQKGMVIPRDIGKRIEVGGSSETKQGTQSQVRDVALLIQIVTQP